MMAGSGRRFPSSSRGRHRRALCSTPGEAQLEQAYRSDAGGLQRVVQECQRSRVLYPYRQATEEEQQQVARWELFFHIADAILSDSILGFRFWQVRRVVDLADTGFTLSFLQVQAGG